MSCRITKKLLQKNGQHLVCFIGMEFWEESFPRKLGLAGFGWVGMGLDGKRLGYDGFAWVGVFLRSWKRYGM